MVGSIGVILAGALFRRGDAMTVHQRAHSHNDYEHIRPLVDALNAGFASDLELVG